MALTRSDMDSAFDEAVGEMVIGSLPRTPVMYPEFFDLQPMTGGSVTHASIGELAAFSEKIEGAELSEDEPVQQFKRTHQATVYGRVLKVTEEMIRDQNWIGASDFGLMFSVANAKIYENRGARVLNNATSTTYHTGEDGLAICASTHTDPDGSTITNFDNLHALSLSYDNVLTARTAAMKIPGYSSDDIVSIIPDELWCPVDLQDTMFTILQSTKAPSTNNNDANLLMGLQGRVWKYMTDTNRWFLSDSNARRMNAKCYVSWPLEIVFDTNWSQLSRRIGGYTRFVYAVKDSRFLTCSEPS